MISLSVAPAPHRASLRGHGAAAPPVGQRLGADHCLGVRPGPVCALPGLHCVSRHHMEEEPHEVRKSSASCQHNRRYPQICRTNEAKDVGDPSRDSSGVEPKSVIYRKLL